MNITKLIAFVLILPLGFVSIVHAHLGVEHPQGSHDYFPDFEVGNFHVGFEESACLHAARDLEEIPDGSGRVLAARSFNRLYMISPSQSISTFLQLSPRDTSGTEGFGALAIHPDFAVTGRPGYGKIYGILMDKLATQTPDFTSGSSSTFSHSVLIEISVDDPSSNTYSGNVRELIRFNESTRIHNVNDIDFGPDSLLYVALGEDNQRDNSQSLSSVYGKILRIDPLGTNSANGYYGIPVDNPFVNDPAARGEIYAIGLRNPWRMNFDSLTGDLYVGDVGLDSIEEVDLVEKGQNYGWPIKEGSFLTANEATPDDRDPITGLTVAEANGYVDPLFEYDQTDGSAIVGSAIVAGTVYRGSKIPALYGKYVFGDWGSKALFYGDLQTGEMGFLVDTVEVEAFINASGWSATRFISIEPDLDGELYLVGLNCIVGLTAIPEPGTISLLLLGVLVFYYGGYTTRTHNAW